MREGGRAQNVKIKRAIERLHQALDSLAPSNIVSSGVERIR